MTSYSSLIDYNGTLYVTDLCSSVLKIDKTDKLSSILQSEPINTLDGWPNAVRDGETIGPTLVSGKMNSPIGITVSDAGEVGFTDWCLGGRVVQLTENLHN
jgi:hypothetical protein